MNESDSANATEAQSWPDYRAVWRWHFYAGIFCIPFVVVLSISGAIYLFKQEIEDWADRPYDRLAFQGQPAAASEHVRAALAGVPNSSFQAYELPRAENDAARVIVSQDGKAKRVFVHPKTLAVLHTSWEEDRFFRWLFKLHGELLMGNRGSALVELAASWTIIMIVTGLFLWWPRGVNRLGGVVYPRFQRGSRVFWRDIHSVTGLWISGLALCLLLTGLPWAKFWGDYFKNVRRLTGTAVARQDWTNGATPAESAGRGASGASGEHQEHSGRGSGSRGGGSWSRGGGGGNRTRSPRPPANLAALDRVVATVKPLGLLPPVTIAPPGGGRSSQGSSLEWTAKSTTANRPYRVDLVLDGATGTIKSRKGFSDRHIIDRVVGTGIALHEGRLFGWPNQLLGLLTAVGLVLLSMSSVILWWRRREAGVLGAPKVLIDPRFSIGLVTLVVLLGIYLPLFGASLVGVLLLEWLLLRRIPKVRDWLGLQRSRADVVALEAAR